MNGWKEIKEQEKKDSYYEFKESETYKLRDILINIANELQVKYIYVFITQKTPEFHHIVYNGTVIGYIYKIENDFLVRYFKELD